MEAFSTAMDRMQRQSGCSRTASDQSRERKGGGEGERDSCFRSLEEPPSLPPSPPLQGKGRERDEEVIVCVCVWERERERERERARESMKNTHRQCLSTIYTEPLNHK